MNHFDFHFYKKRVDKSNFRYYFDGFENLYECYGESAQDLFAITVLKGKLDGTYLEIGNRDPIEKNNTFMLESVFGWKGVSLDIEEYWVNRFNSIRRNKAYTADATKLEYDDFLKEKLPNRIDYLSLDCDPPWQSLLILQKLLKSNYRFNVITFEHDNYGEKERPEKEVSRVLMKKHGYELVVKGGLSPKGYDHEDWYVDPDFVDMNLVERLRGEVKKKDCYTHFFALLRSPETL